MSVYTVSGSDVDKTDYIPRRVVKRWNSSMDTRRALYRHPNTRGGELEHDGNEAVA